MRRMQTDKTGLENRVWSTRPVEPPIIHYARLGRLRIIAVSASPRITGAAGSGTV